MNSLPKSAVPPLDIATKLAAAANLTEPGLAALIEREPRLVELLWFLQWASAQPGGLERFTLDLLAQFAPQFGPAVLHQDYPSLTVAQREEIWKSLPAPCKTRLVPAKSWLDADHRAFADFSRRVDTMLADSVSFGQGYPQPQTNQETKDFRAALLKLTPAQILEAILDAAKPLLAQRLRSMCVDAGNWIAGPTWYCAKLIDVLFEAMSAHAARTELQLARTEVVSLVFDRLDYAWQQKVLVKIEGDARTGKSEAVKAWCAMYPGRARLVPTPSSNSLRDLILAVAEALGLNFTPNVETSDLKDQVQFILRHGRLFLIFDEAHFLLPTSYGRNTNPARLDWVRTEMVDKDLPVALVCTPQAFRHGVQRFEKWTGYNFAQFLGRIMLNVTLPNELSEADLLAVAAVQGPDIPEKLQPFIVARSMQSEGYIKAIEAICSRATYIARRDGHPAVTQADVELAASEVIPAAAPPRPAPAAAPITQHPIAIKRTRPAPATSTTAPALQCPARSIAPLSRQSEAPADAPAFDPAARQITPAMETV